MPFLFAVQIAWSYQIQTTPYLDEFCFVKNDFCDRFAFNDTKFWAQDSTPRKSATKTKELMDDAII